MGKKSRKKKKLKYSKGNFSGIICSACQRCEFIDPSFCFDMYKAEPKRFMGEIYGKLRNNIASEPKTMLAEIFCSGCPVCKKSNSKIVPCKDYPKCLDNLSMQLRGVNVNRLEKRKRKKNKKKNKQRYVCRSYPTFFFGGNPEWEAEVRRLLNADTPSESDRDNASSNTVETATAGAPENSQS